MTGRYVSTLVMTLAVAMLPALAAGQATEAVSKKAAAARGERLTIALISEDQTRSQEWTKPFMVAAFEDQLLRAGRFRVLSRSELAAVVKEQTLSASGFVDPALAVKIGKAASANYVIVVKQIGYVLEKRPLRKSLLTLNMQAQVIDTQSAELIHSTTYSDKFEVGSSGLGQAAVGLVRPNNAPPSVAEPVLTEPYRQSVERFATSFTSEVASIVPLDAIIAAVLGTRIAITGGAELGIREGAEFELLEEGEEIKVGDTVLGSATKLIGRVKVTKVEPKLAWVTLMKTYNEAEREDPSPVLAKVLKGQLARMVRVTTPAKGGGQ
jgi:hypothetical protein